MFALAAATLVIGIVSTLATLYVTRRWTEADETHDDVSDAVSTESQLSSAHSDVSPAMFRKANLRHDLPAGVSSEQACVNQGFQFDL